MSTAAACGDDEIARSRHEPSTSSTVAISDTYGLTGSTMPRTDSEVLAVLERLPDRVAGFARTNNPREVRYVANGRPDMGMDILTPERSLGKETATFADVIRTLEAQEGWVTTLEHLDPDGLSLLVGQHPLPPSGDEPGYESFIATWMTAGSTLMFAVGADAADVRDELVRAFVQAVRDQ